jgi:hypothetical protein
VDRLETMAGGKLKRGNNGFAQVKVGVLKAWSQS